MTALVLMKAIPVTRGHVAMVKFAAALGPVEVLMDWAPGEPDVYLRRVAIIEELRDYASVNVNTIKVVPQSEDDDPNFWNMWFNILQDYRHCDYVVGSEPYCERIAQIIDAEYIPYDPYRQFIGTRATNVRDDPLGAYDQMCRTFQQKYRTTVTVFGAESTGKTTLSHQLSMKLGAPWLFEWARPYLEVRGLEINIHSMNNIWQGQKALQISARWADNDSPYIVQDTDLYSTVGYWEQPHWTESLGECPGELKSDAYGNQSDLYIITLGNIPFEEDVIRYGGDRRESPDEYWIGVAEKYGLNYVVLEDADPNMRLNAAVAAAHAAAENKTARLRFKRP